MGRFRIRTLVAIFLAVSFLFVLLLPTILSIPGVQSAVLFVVEKRTGYRIQCTKVSFGWMSGIEIGHLDLQKRETAFERIVFQGIRSTKPLYSYLFAPRDLASLSIDDCELVIHDEGREEMPEIPKRENGHVKKRRGDAPFLEKQLGAGQVVQQHIQFALPDLTANVTISKGSIVVSKRDGTFAAFQNLRGQIACTPISLSARIDGDITSSTGASTPLEVDVDLSGKELFQDLHGKGRVALNAIPSLLLKGLTAVFFPTLSPYIEPLLGKECQVIVDTTVTPSAVHITSTIASDNLNTVLDIVMTPEEVQIKKSKLLEVTISSDLLNKFSKGMSLQSPVNVQLSSDMPIVYSLSQNSFTSPFQLTLHHTPAIIMSPEKAALSFDANMVVSATALEEKAFLRVAAGYSGTSERAEVTVRGLSNRAKDAERTVDITVESSKGSIPFLSNMVGVSLTPFFDEQIRANLHVEATERPLEALSYRGTYLVSFGDTMRQGSFHGTNRQCAIDDLALCTFESGVLSSKITWKKGTLELQAPSTISFEDRTIDGACVILRSQKELVDAHYSIHLPEILSKSSVLEDSSCTLNVRTHDIDLEMVRPYLSRQNFAMIEKIVGKNIQELKTDLAFHGLSAGENSFDFMATTELCAMTAHLESKNGALLLSGKRPCFAIQGRVTPGLVRAINPSSIVDIAEEKKTCAYSASLSNLAVPLKMDSIESALMGSQATFSWKSDTIHFHPVSQKYVRRYSIAPLSITGSFTGPKGVFACALDSERDGVSPEVDGKISVHFPTDVPLSERDTFLQKVSCEMHLDIRDLDPTLISKVHGDEEQSLREVLGSKGSLNITASIAPGFNGTVSSQFASKNCRFSCAGSLKDGVFYPSQPIVGELTVTEKAGHVLLKEINPLLATAVQSEHPITLAIQHEGVQIPIVPFALGNVSIPRGTISVGKIQVKNRGALKMILSLLRAKIRKENQFELWSTPIYFSLQNGKIRCERADFLAGQEVHIAIWGTIDFSGESLSMHALIPNSALHRLGIQPLSVHGVVIPISGKPSDPKIDKTRLTAKLAALGLRSTTPDPATQIFSGLLEVAASVGDGGEREIPPPTTTPLPWE